MKEFMRDYIKCFNEIYDNNETSIYCEDWSPVLVHWNIDRGTVYTLCYLESYASHD